MVSRAEIKQMAKQQIKGNLGIMFLASIIFLVIIYGISAPMMVAQIKAKLSGDIVSPYNPFFTNVLIYAIYPSFIIGLSKMYLLVVDGLKPTIGNLFDGFKIWGKSTWLYIIVIFYTLLWTLLLVVPGIIKSISYSMSYFILAEKPSMTAKEALNESKRIMNGHKMDSFVLCLSFIGWVILCVITFGIVAIYAAPYMYATYANFYNKIK